MVLKPPTPSLIYMLKEETPLSLKRNEVPEVLHNNIYLLNKNRLQEWKSHFYLSQGAHTTRKRVIDDMDTNDTPDMWCTISIY